MTMEERAKAAAEEIFRIYEDETTPDYYTGWTGRFESADDVAAIILRHMRGEEREGE